MRIEEPKEFIEIKDRYANLLIGSIALVGFIALAASLNDIRNIGLHSDNIIDSTSYLCVLIIFFYRRKLSVNIKIGAIILFSYLIGTIGLFTYSVISMFMPYYVIGALFTMLFFDTRKTIWVISIQVGSILTAFVLKLAGILTFAGLDPNYRAYDNTNWLNYIFTFILFVTVIIVLSRRFYHVLSYTANRLNALNEQLSYEIQTKENAFEEIAASEEELKTANDELVSVNQELSIRNNELISALWKLQESENRFRTLFESASDAFLILKGDKIIDCNLAAETTFELPKHEILGKRIADLSPEFQNDGSTSHAKSMEILDKVKDATNPIFCDWQHINGKGNPFTASISLNHFSFNSENFCHAIVRDITDQKKFEQNLLDSEDKFKKLFELNPAAISLSSFDANLTYLDVNQSFEKLLRKPKSEIIGKHARDLGFNLAPDLYEQLRSQLKTNGISPSTEISLKLNDGSIVNCIFSGVVISFYQQPMIMTITVDITEQKQIQQKLEQYQNYLEDLVNARTNEVRELNQELTESNESLSKSNEELTHQKEELASIIDELRNTQAQLVQSEKMASLGVLTAGIAHEINNPINFISSGVYGLQNVIHSLNEYISNCSEIKKHLGKDEENKESLTDLLDGARRLIENIQLGVDRTSSIVKSLKIFSFPGTGNRELMDIHAGIDATLVMVNHLIKDRIQVIRKYEVIPMVNCLNSPINQVFMNIIYNAIDAIKNQGTITIHTHADTEKNKVTISISDDGEGIPENVQKRIFEPFFTTKEVGKGTGLGLSMSYNIIKEHLGQLYFESSKEKGTTFFIELPIN
ncbi:MAG TPA: ATP-binding protein [Bacteroidales bacterium]|nr:ATP-binding protein [Bacteroidales bacterium]